MNQHTSTDLILASTSTYRRELLSRLGLPFRVQAPDVDESAQRNEAPDGLAARLARTKAAAVAATHAGAIVIGSDQVAVCDNQILGKPGDAVHARAQLLASSGREVVFYTALCVIDARLPVIAEFAAMDTTGVTFRSLSGREIDRYIARDEPFGCAGSFKAEALGIALFERIDSRDPTALIGLPLIALCRLLRQAGIDVI